MTEQETKEMLESTLGPEIDKMAQEVLEETDGPGSSFVAQSLDIYEFDWDKVNTIDDVKLIFKAMGIKFTAEVPNFEELKPLSKKID